MIHPSLVRRVEVEGKGTPLDKYLGVTQQGGLREEQAIALRISVLEAGL